jgi:thioredoxin reductase (NADPH)
MTHTHAKVIVVGSGPAGYTSAIYAARAMMEPILITGVETGGQLTTTTEVENYPGFAEAIQGPWLMEQMKAQAENVGTRIVADYIDTVELAHQPFRLNGDSGDTYSADALIITTGAQAKWLNLPSEQKYRGFGVSACATCDGFFYKDRQVAVIGGGNTAVEEALFLTNFASKVTLIHRRDELRAEKILQNRLFAHPKIEVIWDTTVEDIIGTSNFPPSATGLSLRNVKTGKVSKLNADGIFVAIGHAPSVEFLGDQLKMTPGGYVWTAADSTATNVPGVFAAGDVTDETFRQAVTAAGLGCMAALEAERFLASASHAAQAAE